MPDVGSAAVASGLARRLPSLAQRCTGLLDPVRTMEAAAIHCDLAGLQAEWEVVGQRLQRQYEAAPEVRGDVSLAAMYRMGRCRREWRQANAQNDAAKRELQRLEAADVLGGAPHTGGARQRCYGTRRRAWTTSSSRKI